MVNLRTLTLACTAILPTAAAADWNGSYVGGSAGTVSGATFDITAPAEIQVDLDDTTSLGGFAGFITNRGQFAYGAEIEVLYLPELNGETIIDTSEGPAALTVEHEQLAVDLKGRVGLVFDQVLAYGTVGITAYNFDNNFLTEPLEQSGFSVGAGVDFLATDNLFVGVEFLSRFPTGEITVVGETETIKHESNINTISVRAGFKF